MNYNANFTQLPVQALFDFKAKNKKLLRSWVGNALPPFPQNPNTHTQKDDLLLCYLGRYRWLLRGPLSRETNLLTSLRPQIAPAAISIVLISDSLTFFRITGKDASEVVSIGCPLDLHPSVFGSNAVTYTEFFGQKALIQRTPRGFDCAVDRSFGAMIKDYLNRIIEEIANSNPQIS